MPAAPSVMCSWLRVNPRSAESTGPNTVLTAVMLVPSVGACRAVRPDCHIGTELAMRRPVTPGLFDYQTEDGCPPLSSRGLNDVAIRMPSHFVIARGASLICHCEEHSDVAIPKPTHFVIASVAWQSRRRSNGGSPTCVQPHGDCHVAMLLAMTDQRCAPRNDKSTLRSSQ